MPDTRPRSLAFPLALSLVAAALLLIYMIGQETPVGAIKGRVVAQESGNPLVASVHLTSYPVRQDGESKQYGTESGKDGSFSLTHIPAGDYKLEIDSRAHKMAPVYITIDESRTKVIEAELNPVPPYLDLYVHQHIFTPDEKPQVTCRGFVNSDVLTLQLYRVDVNTFLVNSQGSMEKLLGVQSYYGGEGTPAVIDLNTNAALKLTRSMSVPINTRDLEGIFTQRVDLPILQPGLYVASIRANGVQKLGWLMVTSLGLVSKTAGLNALAYTVDLKTGAPVQGASVAAYVGGKPVASGTTGSDGTLSLMLPSSIEGEDREIFIARKGDATAFVSSWNEGGSRSGTVVYAYTDRPIYRPGQTVHYKGVVRQSTPGGYVVPASKPVTVEVRDSRDTLIYSETRTTDRFGSYYGSFDLNPETATGFYTITTVVGGERPSEPATFQVSEYRKPEFSVKVDFPQKRYTRGDLARANVSAQYYFGAPVANAKVQYLIRRSAYWLFMDEEDGYDTGGDEGGYTDYGGYGEVVKEGEVTTDANGNAVIEFPADWPQPHDHDDWDSDQQFSVEATVVDRSNRTVTGTGSVLATRGEFAISVTPDKYVVEPGAKVNVDIRAMDYDNHPMKDQVLSVVVGRDKWTGGESEFEKLQEMQVKTDNSGHVTVPVMVSRPGDIRIQVSGRDSRLNKIISTAYVWAYTEASEYEDYGTYPDLKIIMDKKTYNTGDTAKVLINTRNPGATALVTVEGSRIYDRRTVSLKSKSTLVEIPIKDDYKPNFYIDVCFVKDKEFAEQSARAKVSLGAQELHVAAIPNKGKYKPGEMATYKIKATDAKGRPAQAQLSLGVVDESIYALAEDQTTPILDYFYARKPNMVRTSFSFPQIYLSDPDKAGAPMAQRPRLMSIKVRKRFLDTAYWNPAITTDSRGEATVSFPMPDNLTTWRATLRGITLGTACGQTTNNVLARQDFMVRLEMPRFLVQTDEAKITAVVHNYTGQDQDVNVLLQAPGLKLDGKALRRVSVRNGEIARLDWNISAWNPGDFDITVRASGNNTGDAMQSTLPVYPHGVERQIMRSGALSGTSATNDTLMLRSDSVQGASRLTVRLAPSLASAMLGSLDYLAEYPYGCTEQTTSSFLPDVILAKSFNSLGVKNARLEKQLPDMVQKGLLRLYRFQLSEGGWGWCEYGQADPWMTAYVCYALIQARNAGVSVNTDVLGNGLGQLERMTSRANVPFDTRVFEYYVLALSGADVNASLSSLVRDRSLSNESLAMLTMAYQQMGRRDQADAALRRLIEHASVEPGMIHWTGADRYGADSTEATALALQAMLKVNPSDPRATEIVRWLMEQRQGNYWYSTRQTAMVLYAMSEFFKNSKELSPDFTATVYVNGKQVGVKHFTRASIFEPEYVIGLKNGELQKGRNSLEIRKSGIGNLYYTSQLNQFLSKDLTPITVTGSGLSINREYFHPSSSYYADSSDRNLGPAVSGCRTGDVILVRLTINSTNSQSHLLVEDMIPAGCEIIDKGDVSPWEWYDWWVGQDVRDEKISFYVDDLSSGKHVITYQIRAGFAGDYHALPAQVFAMYRPEVRASTSECEFTIR